MAKTIRVLAADDHPIVIFALRHALASHRNILLAGDASDSSDLVRQLGAAPYDVLITDFSMPGGAHGDGLAMLEFLRTEYPRLPIILLTMVGNPALLRAVLQLDILGLVSKTDELDHIGPAIFAVHAGRCYLSPVIEEILTKARSRAPGRRKVARLSRRETEVLRLYASGQAVSAIASSLNRSAKTISAQKKTAMRKLGLANDVDLFQYAQSSGFIGAPYGEP